MKMICKMRLDEVIKYKEGYGLVFRPVTGGSEENKEFFKWTPSGECRLSTVNERVGEGMVAGGEYLVEFTPASRE